MLRPEKDTATTVNLQQLPQHNNNNNNNNTRLTAVCPGLPRWAGTRKLKPIWILLKQETVSGSGSSWAICKSAPRFRQITTPAPHHSVFTGRMPFLPPKQQRQSTEGNYHSTCIIIQHAFRMSKYDGINSHLHRRIWKYIWIVFAFNFNNRSTASRHPLNTQPYTCQCLKSE